MIKKIELGLRFQGDKFKPSDLVQKYQFQFTSQNDPGDIGNIGRYKGKPIPYGSASIFKEIPYPDQENNSVLDSIFKKTEEIFEKLADLGVESMGLSMGIFWFDQCNFVIHPKILTRIGKLGLTLEVSCYEIDEEEA